MSNNTKKGRPEMFCVGIFELKEKFFFRGLVPIDNGSGVEEYGIFLEPCKKYWTIEVPTEDVGEDYRALKDGDIIELDVHEGMFEYVEGKKDEKKNDAG